MSRALARRRVFAFSLAAAFAVACLGGSEAADEFDKYALESVGASLSSTQAGAHADLTTSFAVTLNGGLPYANTRDVEVVLPPGAVGNPQALPRCTADQFGSAPEESECPVSSQIGVSEVRIVDPLPLTLTEPVYNMEPPANSDVVARFGLYAGLYPSFINVRVDPSDYSIVASLEGAAAAARLMEARTTIWGVPADLSHDALRLTPQEAAEQKFPPGGRPAGLPPAPFLSNPTDCSLTREVKTTVRSYQLPEAPSTMSAPFPQISGCGSLEFAPTFKIAPTNPEAAAPSGIDAELSIPQNEAPKGRATSAMRSARVSLPEGFVVNPAAADGLEACSASQVRFGLSEPSQCPDAAKIGSVEVEVPALADTLHGAVYQRTPEPGNLFRFWVVADEQGAYLKLPAQIELDEQTGRVTTLFKGIDSLGGLPQVPFSNLKLHVFGGPRAPIATPGACGTYQASYEFVPWSGRPALSGEAPMEIDSGCEKGGFDPRLSAGTLSLRAGSHSPFTFTLTRKDGEANPASMEVHLPLGLTAKLAGVPLCPEAQAPAGTCGAESRIGSLTAATGLGGAPLWIPQPGKDPTAIHLAGPYRGAPYSIVSVVPAQAGPFDLGLVVNRAGIYVDPDTALVTLRTDPLPQILEGMPVSYRTINATVDRPQFMLNPTGCAPKQISATITAITGQVANPTDGFQATNCARLAYSPKLQVSFKGATKRTGNPGVKAVLTQKPNQANTKAATVVLPGSQFIDQGHINNPCTRVQFAADACPRTSILGTVEARTPLFDQPFRGNLYFRSNGGERELPDIVADLRGPNGIRVLQVGFIDSVKGRVRTRFLSIPDVPVSRAVFRFFGGKRGLIENSQNLCLGKRRLQVSLRSHSGVKRSSRPELRVPCAKRGAKSSRHGS